MGAEHRMKGVDVQLGPVAGPLGRSPEGGRNWEGFRSVQMQRLLRTMLTPQQSRPGSDGYPLRPDGQRHSASGRHSVCKALYWQ